MAKKTKDAMPETENPLIAGDEMPEDFFAIQDNRLMYKPEECGERPIRGVMLGTMTMNPSKENLRENPNAKPWTALVVKLTAPCPVISEDGVSIVEAKSGDGIIVGGADMSTLYTPANHPTNAFEVWLKPVGGNQAEVRSQDVALHEGRIAQGVEPSRERTSLLRKAGDCSQVDRRGSRRERRRGRFPFRELTPHGAPSVEAGGAAVRGHDRHADTSSDRLDP